MFTTADIKKVEAECLQKIQEAELYRLRNEAKLRAVNTSRDYDEFKDIVAAAHLNPITSRDKQDAKTKRRIWNTVSPN
ncbi:coiled-coil domain-containing protein 103 [Toxorhynchites rutilus septentrionalis]|uniref:coiled-coil domain-containing protein 103 n=1 Tax=Toxorhynchites rutilus septentrionalis TaxID=329112 RepID=UPI00247ADA28|nr:coiled-coil domain-containing protein 103 [Toxorhynchites rutilus septentrionalis]